MITNDILGKRVSFTYTRTTDRETGREGEVTQRVGIVTEEGSNKRTGRPYIKVDCGDTYKGEPMPKTFSVDAITNLKVL